MCKIFISVYQKSPHELRKYDAKTKARLSAEYVQCSAVEKL